MWLKHFWMKCRDSFWFVPGTMILVSLLLGYLLPEVDRVLAITRDSRFGFLTTTGEAARLVLSSLAGALITVAGVVFSITMVSLSITTSQYGPRLLRTLIRDRVTQLSLGSFLASSIYCLVVLGQIKGYDEEILFTPHLSVMLGVTMSILTLMTVVYFMHHIAMSSQASQIISEVAADISKNLDTLYPASVGETAPEPTPVRLPGEPSSVFHDDRDGYLQTFDTDRLIAFAREHDLVIRLLVQPGDFLIKGDEIATVFGVGDSETDLENELRRRIILGSRTTISQNLRSGLEELVEVAARALSPGINDPFTAMMAIDRLTAALAHLADRDFPETVRSDDGGSVRLILPSEGYRTLLTVAFRQILIFASDNPVVMERCRDGLQRIRRRVTDPERIAAVEGWIRQCRQTLGQLTADPAVEASPS